MYHLLLKTAYVKLNTAHQFFPFLFFFFASSQFKIGTENGTKV